MVFAIAVYAAAGQACHAGDLRSDLQDIASSKYLDESTFGLSVYSISSRSDYFSAHKDIPLIPASNQKLLVTSAALLELSPQFTFKTELYISGPVENSILQGDLIVKGGGDPNLSKRFHNGDYYFQVDAWVKAIQDHGISDIKGKVLIDDSIFDREFFHPSWPRDQAHRWYAAEVGALCLNDSCIDLTVNPSSVGQPVRISFLPYTQFIKVKNTCTTVTGSHANKIIIDRKGFDIYLRGEIGVMSKGFTAEVAIHDPGLVAGAVFGRRLYKAGIRPEAIARVHESPDYAGLTRIYTHESPDFLKTLSVTNGRSQNFYAEMILKYLGYHCSGKGTFRAGIEAVKKILAEHGFDCKDIVMDDSSGLSRKNRISAGKIVELLTLMYDSKYNNDFIKTLAVPADPWGTLRKRLKGVPLKGKIFGKSGYIRKVKALSGYVIRNDGEVLIFSLIVNDFKSKNSWHINRLQDKLMQCLANSDV